MGPVPHWGFGEGETLALSERPARLLQRPCPGEEGRPAGAGSLPGWGQVPARVTGFVTLRNPVSGILKGFDPLLNLVLDGTIEYMRDPDDQYKLTEDTRQLGLVVCRGTSVVLICPQDGMEAIPNPFIQQQDA
ncbi:U6 snRNA-associated Sm-like protein LSm7 isoform X2 [Tursiops truncatus]|uniref:U6 snRNA-associated Sm-like protein LSm7 isoform X1 n=1 Tax=Tursiops truncatus TaxID=9739 RepID=A0A6J3R7K5_TURTR|nr:U6 snRNA-associated Sm-like protein LSm7 isoform X1 [Tursiops truncatus]